MTEFRKSPRLDPADYVGPLVAHLTFVTRGRTPLFADASLARICLDALIEAEVSYCAIVHAYCFMPNHAHVLVEIQEGRSLQAFAKYFKQISGFRLKQARGNFAWQISYYDHILRREEAILDVAQYIWENPVKEGLVDSANDYEWSGPREAVAQA